MLREGHCAGPGADPQKTVVAEPPAQARRGRDGDRHGRLKQREVAAHEGADSPEEPGGPVMGREMLAGADGEFPSQERGAHPVHHQVDDP